MHQNLHSSLSVLLVLIIVSILVYGMLSYTKAPAIIKTITKSKFNSLPFFTSTLLKMSYSCSSSSSNVGLPIINSLSSSLCGHSVTHMKGIIKSNDDILLFYKNTISHCKHSILQFDKIRYDFLRNLDNHNEFLLIEVSKDYNKDNNNGKGDVNKYNNNDELIAYDDRVWSDKIDHMLENTKESIKYRTIYPQKVMNVLKV